MAKFNVISLYIYARVTHKRQYNADYLTKPLDATENQHDTTMTSKWARWRLKSPASWLYSFIQAQTKENSASLAFVW